LDKTYEIKIGSKEVLIMDTALSDFHTPI
jgi:hypothetical protein